MLLFSFNLVARMIAVCLLGIENRAPPNLEALGIQVREYSALYVLYTRWQGNRAVRQRCPALHLCGAALLPSHRVSFFYQMCLRLSMVLNWDLRWT